MAPKRKAKRAASPAADDAEPKRKQPKRGKGKGKAEPIDNEQDDGDAEPPPQPPPAEQKKSSKAKATPEFKEAQVAKAGFSNIPLDEGCPQSNRVYVNPDSGEIYDASLNQTNASGNNNKFYRIQLLQNASGFRTWTRWGRVGERGQSALLGDGSLDDALSHFGKKFKDKSGLEWDDRGEKPKPNKYVFVERSYEPDDEDDAPSTEAGASRERSNYSPPKCTLDPPVKSLMELIFNQQYFEATMAALNYDSTKLPLGKLSKATITRGYQALKELADLLNDSSLAANYDLPVAAAEEHLSNLYYSTIPHAFGRNRPPVIRTRDLLKREIELLESLTDLKDADLIIKKGKGTDDVHPLDSRYKNLGLQQTTPLDPSSEEFFGVSEYLLETCGETHAVNYQVLDIFRIQRGGEDDRFQKSEFSKVSSDRRLLWHGSRATNYGGILGQGLRIAPPEAPVNGYMFDKGIYLADMSSKSANYCDPYTTGGNALLLLCEAELGDPMQVLTNAQYDAGTTAKEKGVYSTWGQGQIGPKAWKDAKCLHPSLAGVKMPDTTQKPAETNIEGTYLQYNEYICYDVARVRLRYLLRVRM
ncbi:hypothetical protein LTR37_020162 [Vermiconidia calcicola]|uniref:Uncharacterized protein n=1 Tax=Vermiconidia calcicola TaxID=1690605 RepID=A0ACC3MC40_9PEZI|nr:hypothetical protein LTR37_020162 [Vermiconidia calcicola]